MQKVRLGKSGLIATKPAMGCLPVQRCDKDYAVRLLRAAYEGGIHFFDTANAYTDSEEKIGLALHDVRGDIVLSTKTRADTKDGVLKHVENSLRMMKTDYIDLVQIHQAEAVPMPTIPTGPMQACWRRKSAAGSGTSASPRTGSRWRRPASIPVCSRPSSFPSAIFPPSAIWPWPNGRRRPMSVISP